MTCDLESEGGFTVKALVMYCDTGGGHHTAAEAMAEELKFRGHEAELFDPFELAGEAASKFVEEGYVKLVQAAPKGFGAMYAAGEAYDRLPVHSPVYWANGKLAAALEEHMLSRGYDCVVMTHEFPAQTIAHMDAGTRSKFKTLLIATDYTCVPFFEETDCDYYGIPALDLKDEFLSKGIADEKILPYGIPVRLDFTRGRSRVGAREAVGWLPDAKYILAAGGSMGAGNMIKTAETLYEYVSREPSRRFAVICGSNEKLYGELSAKYQGNDRVEIIGKTDKMAEYIRASDVFLTKPGGLTSTEAAVCGVVLIHLEPIPGCESANARYFSERGMSIYVSDTEKELLPALERLDDDGAARAMVESQERHISRSAAKQYCEALERVCDGVPPRV